MRTSITNPLLRGILYCIVGTFSFALSNIAFQMALKDLPHVVGQFYSNILCILTVIPAYRQKPIKNSSAFVALVCALTVWQMSATFALTFITSTEHTCIVGVSVFIIPLLSHRFFGIRFRSKLIIFAGSLSLVGLIFLVQPSFLFGGNKTGAIELIGYACAFAAMFSKSIFVCFQRVSDENEVSTIIVSSALSSLLFARALNDGFASFNLKNSAFLIASSLLSNFGTYALMKGCADINPTISGIVLQFQAVFAFIISNVLGMERSVTFGKISGLVLIMISAIFYIAQTRNDDSKIVLLSPEIEKIFYSDEEL